MTYKAFGEFYLNGLDWVFKETNIYLVRFMNVLPKAVVKKYKISFDENMSFGCREGEKLLSAMVRAGVRKIPVGCREGGCGACRIHIKNGEVERLLMGKNHVSDEDAEQGFALACRIIPKSDLVIKLAKKPKYGS